MLWNGPSSHFTSKVSLETSPKWLYDIDDNDDNSEDGIANDACDDTIDRFEVIYHI